MNDWARHIGHIWAEVLAGKVNDGDTIIEVAPGGTDKIGKGLSQLGWRGKLILIEPEPSALQLTYSSYKSILPNCELVPVQSCLSESGITDADVVLANHPLDDMIIGNAMPANEFSNFFSDHYSKPVDLTRKLWSCVNLSNLQNSVKKTVNEWQNLIETSRLTVISQYESYFFKSNDFSKPDDFALEALTAIRNQFGGKLFRNNRWFHS